LFFPWHPGTPTTIKKPGMKNGRKTIMYDWEYMNEPILTTIRRKPKSLANNGSYKVFLRLWIVAGLFMLGMTLLELFAGTMYTTIVFAACNQLSDFFGIDAGTMTTLASEALLKGKNILMLVELALSGLFFINAYYCRRILESGRYIQHLEQAVHTETSMLLKDKEREFEAAE
jgi:hypothetical protein